MTVIYIVRHALTDAHQKRTVLSWTPGIVLNLEGRKQAFRVAEAIKDVELDEIISSPIERAYETASIIAQSKGMNVVKDGRFSEWNMGIWTGRHFDEVGISQQYIKKQFHNFISMTQPHVKKRIFATGDIS